MQASLTPKLKLCPINTGISITWIRCLASLFHLATREVRYQTPEASSSQKETIRELCYQLCLWKFLISESLTWPTTLMIYTFKKTFYKMTVRNFYIYLIEYLFLKHNCFFEWRKQSHPNFVKKQCSVSVLMMASVPYPYRFILPSP